MKKKIKIVKCSDSRYWYYNKIGLILEPITYDLSTPKDCYEIYYYNHIGIKCYQWIYKNDVISIDRKLKLERLLK